MSLLLYPNRTEQIEGIIKQGDPNFSASDFITFTKQVYIDIENAWCKRDLTPVRPVMHENLYNTTNKQVQAKIDQGIVYHYESIAIDTAYLTSYERDSQFEYVTAYLTSRMIDYQVTTVRTAEHRLRSLLRAYANTAALLLQQVSTHGYLPTSQVSGTIL